MIRIVTATAVASFLVPGGEGVFRQVSRQVCGDAGSEPSVFPAGQCQQALSNATFSVIYWCGDDGTVTEAFFINPDCSGRPQTQQAVETGVCLDLALGAQFKLKCSLPLGTAAQNSSEAPSQSERSVESPPRSVVLRGALRGAVGPKPEPAPISDNASWYVARQMCGDTGSKPSVFPTGECQGAVSTQYVAASVMYECDGVGNILEEFFVSSDCSGTPQMQMVESGFCWDTAFCARALGGDCKYSCYGVA